MVLGGRVSIDPAVGTVEAGALTSDTCILIYFFEG